jgi:hypothetical protein
MVDEVRGLAPMCAFAGLRIFHLSQGEGPRTTSTGSRLTVKQPGAEQLSPTPGVPPRRYSRRTRCVAIGGTR